MVDYKLTPAKRIKKTGIIKKNEKAIISIITPYYNGEKYIEETAMTVFNQTFPFFEWIIVDDGSEEQKSIEMLSKIEKQDKRVKIYHKKNEGASIARDYGIEKSSASVKYIFFLDCDDLIENNMLECLYWTLETHPEASFAYTSVVNFGVEEFIWEKYFTLEEEKVENLLCISSLVKKEDLLEVGCFGINEKSIYEDWNLWLKLLSLGKIPVRVSTPLFWYRRSNSGEFSRAKKNHKVAMKYIEETASKIKNDVKAIQFPRNGEEYIDIKFNTNKMILPYYKKEDKKNILFLIPWMPVGGAERFNLEILKRTNQEKYNYIIISMFPNENLFRKEFCQFANECYDLSSFLDRKDYLVFVDYIITSRNIDIVFINHSTYGYSMIPYIKSKHKNVSTIDYIHAVDFRDPRGGFGRFTSDFDAYLDRTYTCNEYTTKELINKFNKSKCETIYIGTDYEKFDPKKVNKEALRQKYNIPMEKIVITFIARLVEEKRPKLFVKIANELLKENKNYHFLIVGGGPQLLEVKKLIKKFDIKNNFSVLGWIDSNKSEEIYGLSDMTINCSTVEGLALTSFESLSMGVPVISTSVYGQPELIDDTVGKIVPHKDNATIKEEQEELYNYVNAVKTVEKNIKVLSQNCRKKIIKEFNLELMKEKFEHIFDTIKPTEISMDIKSALNIHKIYLESLYLEYDWFCKEYNSKFGIIENNLNNNGNIKNKIKNKIINFSNKFRIKEEMKTIANFLRTFIVIFKDIKWFIFHCIYLIKYFIKSIISTMKIIKKVITKMLKRK